MKSTLFYSFYTSDISLRYYLLALQGVPKNLLESGAHKTHFLDTFTLYLGGVGTCLFIDFLFLDSI